MENKKVVGTFSYRIIPKKGWYYTGDTLDVILIAVLPAYRRKHLASQLYEKVEMMAREGGYPLMTLDTQESNQSMRKFAERNGYQYVNYYRSANNTQHYCVTMAKWLSKKEHSHIFFRVRFAMKWLKVRIKNALSLE